MIAYYNEIDPNAAQWLRNLIEAGHIAEGDVDERSIVDVRAEDNPRSKYRMDAYPSEVASRSVRRNS